MGVKYVDYLWTRMIVTCLGITNSSMIKVDFKKKR
jgi:hypothetical protein